LFKNNRLEHIHSFRDKVFWDVTPCSVAVGYQCLEDLADSIFILKTSNQISHMHSYICHNHSKPLPVYSLALVIVLVPLIRTCY